jgi:trk system potassium uptake protein TrkA
MKVVILGAGTVGRSIAESLSNSRHGVTIVDRNPTIARDLNRELDVRAFTGLASQSTTLFQAEVQVADLCLAVTGDDEVNIVAASLAKAMGARRSVARVYAPILRDLSTFDYESHFNIDRMLSLEHLTAMEFARQIRNPGSVMVENFTRGELEFQETTVSEQSPFINKSLKQLDLPKGVRIGSIARKGDTWIAGAGDKLEAADRVTLIGKREEVEEVSAIIQKESAPQLDVVIAGGGETGFHLASILESAHCNVMLMESCEERCQVLSRNLNHTTVIHADATSRAQLEEERVGSADVCVICTGDDENNIMVGVEAKDLGVDTVMCVVTRPDYANVVGNLGINVRVSPRDVMARQVLNFLHTGPVVSRTILTGSSIAVYELEVQEGSAATEHVLAKLPLPEKSLIAAVFHRDYVRVPGADDRLESGDSVVALIENSVVEETLEQFSVNGR